VVAVSQGVSLREDLKDLVKKAEEIGRELVEVWHLNTNQLRKFHGHLTKIWSNYIYKKKDYKNNSEKFNEEILNELHFMKIFLVYQSGRKEIKGIEGLKRILEPLIDEIKTPDDFEKFKKFYDAILAYHKFHSESERNDRRAPRR
jgi:CRISPR-associated protein Csm2